MLIIMNQDHTCEGRHAMVESQWRNVNSSQRLIHFQMTVSMCGCGTSSYVDVERHHAGWRDCELLSWPNGANKMFRACSLLSPDVGMLVWVFHRFEMRNTSGWGENIHTNLYNSAAVIWGEGQVLLTFFRAFVSCLCAFIRCRALAIEYFSNWVLYRKFHRLIE